MLEKQPVTDNRVESVDGAKITQTTRKPKYSCRICKGSHLLKDFLGLSKVIEAWYTHPCQPMSSSYEQHDDALPSTSQDTVEKKKSRVNFLCRLCGGSHQTHIFPHMDEASKLLEDMIVLQPPLLVAYHSLTLNPPVVDGMINMVPSLVGSADQVVNMVMSLVKTVEKVVDMIPSSFDPTLPLESETQAVDLFPLVNPILPLENATQVVDMIPSSVDRTLSLESKPDTAHIFLVDTNTTVLGGIPPSPMEPPPSHEAILFYWGALTGPHIPSHFPFNIKVQVCGWDIPQMLLDKGASISILSFYCLESFGLSLACVGYA
jgi:hypothetical protein